MDIDKIFNGLAQFIPSDQLLKNESMKKHTSFRIGGPADIMVLPSENDHIVNTLKWCRKNGIPIFVMGNGSNLLVYDKGIRGVVLKISDRFCSGKAEGTVIKAQAGILLSALSRMALKASLKGLEFASGIPGTLGGAVAMNAGAYGGEMKDVVTKVLAVDHGGNQLRLSYDELDFSYRHSYIQENNLIVLEVIMNLQEGNYEESRALMADLTKRRQEKQPLTFPSAGSTFKRPVGYYAGKLIQDCGLKGMRVGDAQVSDLHSGFIINLGNATACDVIELIEKIKNRVWENFGVELHPEVRIVGEQ